MEFQLSYLHRWLLTFFLHWLDQRSLILKICLWCCCKLSVVRIQTVHADFLPPQVCGRSWRGFRLAVQTCLLQLITCIDLKYPSSYSFKPRLLIVDLCVSYYWISVHLSWNLYLGSIANFPWAVSKTDIWIYFQCRFLEGCGEGARFLISPVIINT